MVRCHGRWGSQITLAATRTSSVVDHSYTICPVCIASCDLFDYVGDERGSSVGSV